MRFHEQMRFRGDRAALQWRSLENTGHSKRTDRLASDPFRRFRMWLRYHT